MARMLGGGEFDIELKPKTGENSFMAGQKVEAIIKVRIPEELLLEGNNYFLVLCRFCLFLFFLNCNFLFGQKNYIQKLTKY